MFVKRIKLEKLGPIEEFIIEPRFSQEGNPVPIMLVGQNGAGKSLTLSVILDAMTEARRGSFRKLPEVSETDYLRLSSKNYVRHSGGYSHAQVKIGNSTTELEFNEVVSKISFEHFQNSAPELAALPNLMGGEFRTSGFYKNINVEELHRQEVQKLTFLYFPYFRYETAYWMSETANVDFVKQSNFYGQSKLNPIRTNIIEDTKRWILNVLLDREIYEKIIVPSVDQNGSYQRFLGYAGPNASLFQIVNEILTSMFKAKDATITSARLGIGAKGNREISVFITRQGQAEIVMAPDISQLSSGELMTLGLATEIIRAHELTCGKAPGNLTEVTGIVLIDEIDLHLHISFQKNVLPLIVRKFPRVQFIATTHSPFFLLGLTESGDVDIYSLPIGNRIGAEEFAEFQTSYEIFIDKNNQFRERYLLLQEQANKNNRTLLITEGKTDWKHIKYALTVLQAKGKHTEFDVEFLEFEDETDMGDSKLSQMCEYMATLPQSKKIIFIFDRDNPTITKKMSGDPDNHKSWGNHVYSLCLPVPTHRNGYKNLSIELYYTDNDLRTADPISGKRLWFTNEIEIVTRPSSGQKIYRALPSPITADELDKKCFDQPADKIVDHEGNPVGLSKAAFTEVIACNPDVAGGFDLSAFDQLFNAIKGI
ncbi:AAA family ATPase [Pseudomonas putida]|uniref:AAA family ATPase n=1 Tax=Pseudomonas putida TaxID=303 RepID=UPI00064C98CB|nr:AAA family ATPase [Pseudomonas putida]